MAVAVSAALIVRDGRILVCQRNPRAQHPGKFEFPGGKVEPDETPEQCLRRELSEELGIDSEIGEMLWRTHHAYPSGTTVDLMFFAVTAMRGELDNRIFASLIWARPFDLNQLDLLEGDREIATALATGKLTPPETQGGRS